MTIDLPTLMLAGSFVAAVSGAFLFFAWLQNRETMAPLWWAGANLALAIGVPLISSSGTEFGLPSTVLGILLLNLSPAMVWAAAVSSNRRSPSKLLVATGATIWMAGFVTVMRLSNDAQMALNLAIIAVYLIAAAAEFWVGNRGLQTRLPLIVLLLLHGTFFGVGAALAATGKFGSASTPSFLSWLGLIHFETLAFVVGTAIFAVAMIKEQREMVQKTAARVDPLTGVANRRAFLEEAAELLEQSLFDGKPFSVIVFDLDRFKAINDGHGHATGDRILEEFGKIATSVLRKPDLVGRLGGEEFAIALPGSSANLTLVIAERIRHAFADSCRSLAISGLSPTLSGGIAESGNHAGLTIDSILAEADKALYRAKSEGRDRIVVASAEMARTPMVAVPLRPSAARAA